MPRVRLLATLGLVGVALCMVLVGALHVLAADLVDPVRRTISEYALGEFRPLFDVGVLTLAAGSSLVLAALVRARLAGPAAASLLAGWAVALVVLVAFEKANWSVGPSVGGYIHRYASLVAFVCLPLAALLIARGATGPFAAWARGLAVASAGWLAVIVVAFLLRGVLGVPWWQVVPLGLVERGLAVTEVATVVVLALWAHHAARLAPRTAAMIGA